MMRGCIGKGLGWPRRLQCKIIAAVLAMIALFPANLSGPGDPAYLITFDTSYHTKWFIERPPLIACMEITSILSSAMLLHNAEIVITNIKKQRKKLPGTVPQSFPIHFVASR